MNQEDGLLTVREVANMLKIGRYTVYRWIKRGFLEGIELPTGVLRITRKSVDRIIERGKRF